MSNPTTTMMNRTLVTLIAVLTCASFGFAQQPYPVQQPNRADSTAIPTLAELKAEFLQYDRAPQGAVNLPSQHRALFCRFDDKLDKKKIPLRMRLGSVEEVNRMEAKPGFRASQVVQ